MNCLKTALFLLALSCFCLLAQPVALLAGDGVNVEIVKLDPEGVTELGNNEPLFALVRYQSDVPLRFQAIAVREGLLKEVGAIRNPAALHAPGNGEALVWVSYTNPTHVDTLLVNVLDHEWVKIDSVSVPADLTWSGVDAATPRQPAAWVDSLVKSERRKIDFVYDPSPQKNESLYDILFFLTVASIPAYILLQLHMLYHYKYRWRELAFIPIFPYLVVGFYALAGLDIERSLQVTFLFRYTPCALLYLVALWCAKRFWQNKLPPPKLYKQPKPKE